MCVTFFHIKKYEQENKEIVHVNNFCPEYNKYGTQCIKKNLPQGISYMQTRI